MRLTDPVTGETLLVRRITIPLRTPNKKGEKALYVLTNLPAEKASACLVADLYAKRWTIETAFQQLTDDLRCEIDTLAYPRGLAWFLFGVRGLQCRGAGQSGHPRDAGAEVR